MAAAVALKHGIKMCFRCNCRAGDYELGHSRAHAHCHKNDSRKNTICLARSPKTFVSFFTTLHEIGHCVHPQGCYGVAKTRALAEHNATEWAKNVCRELNVPLKRKVIAKYNWYIGNKVARGIRRGLTKVPSELRKYGVKENADYPRK